jgi:hypothetical protein
VFDLSVPEQRRIAAALTSKKKKQPYPSHRRPAMRPCLLHVCLIAVSPSIAASVADAAPPDEPEAFDTADMHVEKNATDDDTEIVIEAVGGDDGLCQFRIHAPDGRPIFHFKSVDRSTVGSTRVPDRIPRTVGRRHPRELSGGPLPVSRPEL